MNDLGNMLRIWREKENLTQADAAQLLGISRNYVSQIERGLARNLSVRVHARVCKLIGYPHEIKKADTLKSLFVEMYTAHCELAGVVGSDENLRLAADWRNRYMNLTGHFVWD